MNRLRRVPDIQKRRVVHRATLVAAAVGLLGIGYWGGVWQSRDGQTPRPVTGVSRDSVECERVTHRSVSVPVIVHTPTSAPAPFAEDPARAKEDELDWVGQTEDWVDRLMEAVSEPASLPARSGRANSESLAAPMRHYVQGFATAVRTLNPAAAHALSGKVTDILCGGSTGAAQELTLAYLLQALPDAMTSDGLDCFLANSKGETSATWEMLEAWSRSDLEKTPGLAQLEQTARDSRTQHYFSDPETEEDLPVQPATRVVRRAPPSRPTEADSSPTQPVSETL